MSQLRELAEPFKGKLVKAPPRGKFGSYVSHSTVNERALSVVGPFDQHIVMVIRGWTDSVTVNRGKSDERTYPERDNAVIGCVLRITAVIDGRQVSVEEAGDVENAAAQSDGENLKEAVSDAFKRAWMRPGLGLHLWSQDDYFLTTQLDKQGGTHIGDAETYEVRNGAGDVQAVIHSPPTEPITEHSADDPERPFNE